MIDDLIKFCLAEIAYEGELGELEKYNIYTVVNELRDTSSAFGKKAEVLVRVRGDAPTFPRRSDAEFE